LAALFSPKSRLKFIMFDTDHIDPRWEEGRDYQMVCGLDDPLNYCERDSKFNTAKSNRFLPWRVASDEIGTIPVNQGDLCLFLVGADIEQDIPGEWVLMEFLSEKWFECSYGTAGYHQPGCKIKIKEWRQENPAIVQQQLSKCWEGGGIWRKNNPEKVQSSIEKALKAGEQWRKENPDIVKQQAKKAASAALKRLETETHPKAREVRVQYPSGEQMVYPTVNAAIVGLGISRKTFYRKIKGEEVKCLGSIDIIYN
jgi:hypothetical protein